MTKKIGLWIDHRKAIIITLSDKGEEMTVVNSNIEKHIRPSAHTTASYGRHEIMADDSKQRGSTGHLNTYYKAVIESIHDAESILILGPGEAKGELKKHLEDARLGERVVGVEAADEMTEPQITAKVRQHFKVNHSPH
jgi:hypothetical protein